MAAAAAPAGLKILMLHGFTQSGALFHAKTRALEKALLKAFPASTLHYADGPTELAAADIPGYDPANHTTEDQRIEAFAWWRRRDGAAEYAGIDRFFQRIADAIHAHGPFDGVIGFSQGACAAPMVAALLEPGRPAAFHAARAADPAQIPYPPAFLRPDDDGQPIQAPLQFAIAYAGFAAPADHYRAFYQPPLRTPVLHVLGSLDTLVSEDRSRQLVRACHRGDERTVVHPGGHVVPMARPWLDKVLAFIHAAVTGTDPPTATEQRVEDMDVPF